MSSSSASCQLDPIPTWLVKQCAKELAPIFAKMINSSLTSGVIPENWKLALVIPLFKKLGLELIFNSFRPVSNLPFISKTAKKVVIPQVRDHCEANAPHPNNQSSYRQYHSTETALLKVQNDISLKMDKQEATLLILLDLSAAFDTIDHGTMLQILENDFGITGNALCWLSSFLVSRKQRVLVNGWQSRDFAVNTGVPQGSCPGPILFIMYPSSQDNAVQAMEACISDVRSWMINHHLKLNDGKTEFIIIGSRQQLAKVNIDHINVGTSDIRPVGSVQNLGLWFDCSMTMS